MASVLKDGILISEVETKNIMTKSSLPVGGYSVNPYVGCTHGCKYCYASFMKRFTGHTEEWGTFLDVKRWPEIKNPQKYAGIRTVCFVSPVFPGITDFEAIFERVRNQCDLFWLENLNLRGGFKKTIMDYIAEKYPHLLPLYREIYDRHDRSFFEGQEQKAKALAEKYDCPFVDNELPYGRVPQGRPVIVDYFYHEEVRDSDNTGRRKKAVTP